MALPARPFRLSILLLVLGGCLVVLLAPRPVDALMQGEWRFVDGPNQDCVPFGQVARWDMRYQGDGMAGIDGSVIENFLRQCEGPQCALVNDVQVTATWHDKPWFLSGLARLTLDTTIERTLGDCHEVHRATFEVSVDHGTRGTVEATLPIVGRALGQFLYTRFGPRRRR